MKVFVLFALVAFACQVHWIAGTPATRSVVDAVQWLLQQREGDFTWGDQTSRAVVALALAEEVHPLQPVEWRMMAKQVNILLSLELAKPNGLALLGLTRTSLYMNALLATCQDPTRFHGLDLARDLRERLNTLQNAHPNTSASLPAAYLALCLAGRSEPHRDVHVLDQAYKLHAHRPDQRAIALLAMACLGKRQPAAMAPRIKQYVEDFGRSFPDSTGTVDVYTKALGYQALSAAGRGMADKEPLIRHQTPSGSFGSLLATYYAIPALLNSSLLDLKDRRCPSDRAAEEDKMAIGSGVQQVFYSLWMGEGQERDTHSLTLPLDADKTFFDLMQVASKRNPVFRFSWEDSVNGKKVYSLAERPNDVEREIYWTLFKTSGSPNQLDPQRLNIKDIVHTGVDRVKPSAGDHFVFWFRRKP